MVRKEIARRSPVPLAGSSARTGAGLGVTMALAAIALTAFRLLAQPGLHWFDSAFVLERVRADNPAHPWHLLAMWPFVAVHRGLQHLAFLGVDDSALSAGRWTVAASGAVLVAAAHRAALSVGRSARDAVALAALVAVTPGVLYFATIVELQGPAMAGAGIAIACSCRLGRDDAASPAVVAGRMVATGCASALAAGLHSSLHVLPLALPLLGRGGLWSRGPWRTALRNGLGVAVVHGLGYWALLTIVGGPRVVAGAAGWVGGGFDATALLGALPRRALQELLLPFLPTALVVLAAAVRWRRSPDLWLLLVVAGALAVAVVVLRPIANDERGAYLLFLAVPFAARALDVVPPRRWHLLFVVALLGAAWLCRDQARQRPVVAELAADVASISRGRPFLLVTGEPVLLDSLRVFAPEIATFELTLSAALPADGLPALAQQFDLLLTGAPAGRVVVDEATWRRWREGEWPVIRRLVAEHIAARHRVTAVSFGSFHGVEVTRRN